jgi:hypothetical protein
VPMRDTPRLDVPSLLQLTVEALSRQLGSPKPVPAAFRDPTLMPLIQRSELMDSTVLFQYQGLNVVVSYDFHTRHVKELLLIGSDEDELMNRGKLRLEQNRYLVLPIFQERRPTELLGLRVLPTHQ